MLSFQVENAVRLYATLLRNYLLYKKLYVNVIERHIDELPTWSYIEFSIGFFLKTILLNFHKLRLNNFRCLC